VLTGSIEFVRYSLRRRRGWRILRRLQLEGWGTALSRWRTWLKILDTPSITTEPVTIGSDVEVHLLCYERDYLCAIWALKSFYHFANVRYPLVIHLQGKITALAERRIRFHFPFARIISQTEADNYVEQLLGGRGFERLLAARRSSPFMLKLTDFTLLCQSKNLLALDTDLVFFQKPTELLRATQNPLRKFLFQHDQASTYNLSIERALSELDVELAPRVNTGIMLFPRESLDLSCCEKYLAHPDVARPSGWIEQTLYALCASVKSQVAYLPDSYLVSLESDIDLNPVVARHYAGPTRPMLTTEGMAKLIKMGFLEALRSE
jgi:hypothetical protein